MSEKYNGKAVKFYIEVEKGVWQETDTPVFVSGMGLRGDRHFGDEKSQICLMDENVRRWMESQPVKGLCFKKIQENILVSGVDFKALRAGDEIMLGEEGPALEITASGKHCFPDKCDIAGKGEPCLLRSGVAFAMVKPDFEP